MYSHIHSTYVAEGLDLLVELSMSSTTYELRILRQRSLANYARSLATELAEYIARVGFPCNLSCVLEYR